MTTRQSDAAPVSRRNGRARVKVLQALEALGEPVSAEELAANVPDVHVSSVYRALSILEEDGIVTHVHLGHGPAVYQLAASASEVRHLVCDTCGRQLTVPASVFDEVSRTLREQYDFVLNAGHFAVVGHCTTCASER